ncbi:MAG: hypothetical protein OEM97_09980, partial [Acidimicrobiia bacterium]|nr:hypothetical protein [Acidimicrobiia bacterium]
ENDDPKIVERVQAYRNKIRSGLTAALAQVEGLDPALAASRTELLLAAVLGLHITARSALGHPEVECMTFAVCDQIDAWDHASAE